MKRDKFIFTITAAAAAPFALNAQPKKKGVRNKASFKTASGEGRIHGHIALKGVNQNLLDVKVSGRDTNGDLAIFEQTSLSQGRGTPLHIHPNQDEVFYVLEGEYLFQVGTEKYDLEAGDSIFLPRAVPHAWTQKAAAGRMIVTLQPAGKLEGFFTTMAALDHEPTQEEIKKIFSDHEMVVVGPPLKID
ncbi:MAG: cupin domain-containing protein [Bacteroidota bacterium]